MLTTRIKKLSPVATRSIVFGAKIYLGNLVILVPDRSQTVAASYFDIRINYLSMCKNIAASLRMHFNEIQLENLQ